MEELFLLAERIVHNFKKTISPETFNLNRYSFEESIIRGSSLSIIFSNSTKKIVLNLSTHHLDMPWHIDIKIVNPEKIIDFTSIIKNTKGIDPAYEVYPILLRDPDKLGNKLAQEIADDLLIYLTA